MTTSIDDLLLRLDVGSSVGASSLPRHLRLEFIRDLATDNDVRIAYLAGRITPDEAKRLKAALRRYNDKRLEQEGYEP